LLHAEDIILIILISFHKTSFPFLSILCKPAGGFPAMVKDIAMDGITISDIISIIGLLLGGGSLGGWLTWKYARRIKHAEAVTAEAGAAKELQDLYQQLLADVKQDRDEQKTYIQELKEDRSHLRKDRNELSRRLDRMEEEQRNVKREVARNGRMVEAMRPFMCGDLACTKRQRVTISADGAVEQHTTPAAHSDIEPISNEDL